MKPKSTDHLIADVLAMGMEMRQHLEDKRRRLTRLQIEALTNAVAATQNYFESWKAHELACRDTVSPRPSIASRNVYRENAGGTASSPLRRHLKPV
jgi:hypothetical protein